MDDENIIKQSYSGRWRTGRVDGGNCRWLPVIRVDELSPWLGISELGGWVVEKKNNELLVLDGPTLVAAFPLLERKEEALLAQLAHAVQEGWLSIDQSRSFPIQQTLCLALASNSDYWQGLALGWLHGGLRNENMLAAIELVSKTSNSQKNRHHAQRILKVLGK